MHLYTEREIYGYAQAIDKKISKHYPKGNASYEAMFNKCGKDEILAMSVEVSNEFKNSDSCSQEKTKVLTHDRLIVLAWQYY